MNSDPIFGARVGELVAIYDRWQKEELAALAKDDNSEAAFDGCWEVGEELARAIFRACEVHHVGDLVRFAAHGYLLTSGLCYLVELASDEFDQIDGYCDAVGMPYFTREVFDTIPRDLDGFGLCLWIDATFPDIEAIGSGGKSSSDRSLGPVQ